MKRLRVGFTFGERGGKRAAFTPVCPRMPRNSSENFVSRSINKYFFSRRRYLRSGGRGWPALPGCDRSPSPGFRRPCAARVRQLQLMREDARFSCGAGYNPTLPPPIPGASEESYLSHDSGHLIEHLPPEYLAFLRQTLPLIIVEQNAFLAELFSEHAILGTKVFNHVLLLMVDPAGEDQEQ
jgi:hypothetical protein